MSFLRNSNLYLIFTVFFFLGMHDIHGQQLSFDHAAMTDIVKSLEKQYKVSFAFDSEILDDQYMTVSIDNLDIESALVKVFRGSNIGFQFFSANEIILNTEKDENLLKIYSKHISGFVKDKISEKGLSFVNVNVKGTTIGASTNEQGYFELDGIFVADDLVEISYIGYEKQVIPIDIFLGKSHNVYLALDESLIEEVIIEDYRIESLFSNNVQSGSTFDIESMEKLSTGVERDVFQTLQLIPGVSGSNESSSDLNVRGGNSGQNLVLFDDINLYHFGHFFGKVSATNPNYIDKVSFYKESANAKFGGRVSSVIDIKGKNRIAKNLKLAIESSMISTNAVLELPIISEKFGIVVGGRRAFTDIYGSKTYDQLLEQVFQNTRLIDDEEAVAKWDDDGIVTLAPNTFFEDYNAKIIWKPTKSDRLELNYLYAKDILSYSYTEGEFRDVDSVNIRNVGLNLIWNHKWNKVMNTRIVNSYTKFLNNYQLFDNLPEENLGHVFLENGNELKDYALKIEHNIKLVHQKLTFGYQLSRINQAIKFERLQGKRIQEFFQDTTVGITHSTFVDYEYKPLKKLVFNVGGRFSHYNLSNEFYMEPRFFVTVNPFGNFRIMVAGGIYNQTINKIETYNQLQAENYFWILSRTSNEEDLEKFAVVRNRQYSMSFSSIFQGWKWSIGGYDKILDDVAGQTIIVDAGTLYNSGQITSRGLEFSLSKKSDSFHTYLAYTLSKSKIKLQFDESFLTPYDELHRFNMSQSYSYKNVTASFLWSLASGKPYSTSSRIESNEHENPEEIDYWIEFDSYNSKRLDYYSRFDFSLHYFFEFNKVDGKITFSILNLLDRENVLKKVFWVEYPDEEEGIKLDIIEENKLGLGITPNIGLLINIGGN